MLVSSSYELYVSYPKTLFADDFLYIFIYLNDANMTQGAMFGKPTTAR